MIGPIHVAGLSAPLLPTGEPAKPLPDDLLLTRAVTDVAGRGASSTTTRLVRTAFILGWRAALAIDRAARRNQETSRVEHF